MFEKNNDLNNKFNPSGETFHELTKDEMLLITGGQTVEKDVRSISILISASASISAVSGLFSHRHC